MYDSIGPFEWDEDENEDIVRLPYFGPVEMEQGLYYYGQWRRGTRCGRGQ
jgi:hypothetical protein